MSKEGGKQNDLPANSNNIGSFVENKEDSKYEEII